MSFSLLLHEEFNLGNFYDVDDPYNHNYRVYEKSSILVSIQDGFNSLSLITPIQVVGTTLNFTTSLTQNGCGLKLSKSSISFTRFTSLQNLDIIVESQIDLKQCLSDDLKIDIIIIPDNQNTVKFYTKIILLQFFDNPIDVS